MRIQGEGFLSAFPVVQNKKGNLIMKSSSTMSVSLFDLSVEIVLTIQMDERQK